MQQSQETIDYNLLNKALKYFSKKGFKQVEVPWRVSEEAIQNTFDSKQSFKATSGCNDKFLIGSAEQGFLELCLQDNLKDFKYNQLMSVSPCFRNDTPDYFHQQEFIKLELIYFSDYALKSRVEYNIFREFVVSFIIKKLKIKSPDIVILETKDANSIYSEDILINGIEYGSYGIRQFQDKYYIYGTGIALPRTSKILKSLD